MASAVQSPHIAKDNQGDADQYIGITALFVLLLHGRLPYLASNPTTNGPSLHNTHATVAQEASRVEGSTFPN